MSQWEKSGVKVQSADGLEHAAGDRPGQPWGEGGVGALKLLDGGEVEHIRRDRERGGAAVN